jgi:hypothetical protein
VLSSPHAPPSTDDGSVIPSVTEVVTYEPANHASAAQRTYPNPRLVSA